MIAKLSIIAMMALLANDSPAESQQQQVRPNLVTPNKAPAGETDLKKSATKTQTSDKAPPMMAMSLVAPLFIEDASTANTLTIVHDAATQAIVQVSIVDLQGQKIAAFSKPIATHGQTVIVLADELLKLRVTGPVSGSLIATPNPSNVSLAGQLSIIRKGMVPAEDLEEELPMIDSSRKNTFMALATGATGQPVVAVRSSSLAAQTLSIVCLIEGRQPQQTQRTLGANQGLFIDPCKGQDVALALDHPEKTLTTPKVVGVSITSDAMPGSLSIFGLVPRGIGPSDSYEPLQFHQAGSPGQLSNVYPGVPLGPTTDLQSLDFQPEIGLSNFGATPAHVLLRLAKGGDASTQPIATVTVPAYSSVRIPLSETAGDPGMANTITIQSDVTDSQLISNLRAVSTADRSIFVEVPNQNPAKSTNGGQHPWFLSATTTSKLYLYNATADSVTPTIRVYNGSQLWVQPTKLAPFETKVLDIRSLFDNAVKDSKGHVLTAASNGNLQGIVSWNSLKTNSIHGRVLQIDRTTLLTRNFSCELVYIACGAGFDPSSLFTVISASGDVLGGATTCPSIGQCTCDGSSCPGGVLEEASGYGWFVYNPDIAPITAGTYSSTATFFGNSVGNTTFDLSVSDDIGCYADGQGPVTVNPVMDPALQSLFDQSGIVQSWVLNADNSVTVTLNSYANAMLDMWQCGCTTQAPPFPSVLQFPNLVMTLTQVQLRYLWGWYVANKLPSPTGTWPGYNPTSPNAPGYEPDGNGDFVKDNSDGSTEKLHPDLGDSKHGPHWDYNYYPPSGPGAYGGRIYPDPDSTGGIFVHN
jgi:hypothetical protein